MWLLERLNMQWKRVAAFEYSQVGQLSQKCWIPRRPVSLHTGVQPVPPSVRQVRGGESMLEGGRKRGGRLYLRLRCRMNYR
jgi:hypothetical protein